MFLFVIGLTAVKAEDVYDLMVKDYPEKFKARNLLLSRSRIYFFNRSVRSSYVSIYLILVLTFSLSGAVWLLAS